MISPLRVSEPASDEFRAAVRWYEGRRRGLGGEFFDAVVATLSLIETRPEIGSSPFRDPETRRMLVSRFPYQVVYRLVPDEIIVVAIAHLRRRPGYWKHRTTSSPPNR